MRYVVVLVRHTPPEAHPSRRRFLTLDEALTEVESHGEGYDWYTVIDAIACREARCGNPTDIRPRASNEVRAVSAV
jgi:hypothetical protein